MFHGGMATKVNRRPEAGRTTAANSLPSRADETRVFLILLGVRLINALTVQTFFQPDEYFQSLEPAWQLAFGAESGAWIAWEWRQHLRSSLHPHLFATVYKTAAWSSDVLRLPARQRAEILVVAPKIVQAIFAAVLDVYTWKLANQYYGRGSRASSFALFINIFSPWQWFCSVRTLVNSLEATLTAVALYHWPWELFGEVSIPSGPRYGRQLLLSLTLAALTCILRPPNLMIWLVIGACSVLFRLYLGGGAFPVLSRVLCYSVASGLSVLIVTIAADWNFYGVITFPPYKFVRFNVVQNLAVFYGRNRIDYYLTEGLPLLLTTFLPFAVVGMCSEILVIRGRRDPSVAPSVRLGKASLVLAVITTVAALSSLPHKEVRFLSPLLPILHVLAAPSIATFFGGPGLRTRQTYRKVLLSCLVAFNVVLASYITRFHQRGVIDVESYLRHAHERLASRRIPDRAAAAAAPSHGQAHVTTVGFLTPCHSTPWRSHLVYPEIHAWALTCDPPLDVPQRERPLYLDEADRFYANTTAFLTRYMHPPSAIPTLPSSPSASSPDRDALDADSILMTISRGEGARAGWSADREAERGDTTHRGRFLGAPEGMWDRDGRRAWPMFLVMFAQLEGVMEGFLNATGAVGGGGGYEECWRGFNSHWHDDWRRQGDVVVWCLGAVKEVLER